MAHLIRPWLVRYVDKDGKRCPKDTPGARKVKQRARKWYGAGIPGLAPGKRIPLAAAKDTARQMLAELVKKGERGENPLEDRTAEAGKKELRHHLADFEAALRARQTSPKEIRLKLARIRGTFDACNFTLPRHVESDAVMGYLSDRLTLPTDQGGISPQTANYYLTAVGQFCRWMVRKERMTRNPLADAVPFNARLDRRHDRRDLKAAELAKLLETTAASADVYRGLTGPDRELLYHAACGTGFRVSELAALTPAAFDLDAEPPAVTVGAAYTKNKKRVRQPLPAGLAAALRAYLDGKPADAPVWPGTWHERAAEMLKADLESAGIAYVVKGPDGPLYADFHSLRHTFVSMLEQSGAAPKAAQSLARHSDIRLTMNRYTHADHRALAAAVDRLELPRAADAGPAAPAAPTAEQLAAGFLLLLAVYRGVVAPVVAPMVAPDSGSNRDGAGQAGTGTAEEAAADPRRKVLPFRGKGRTGTG